MESRLWEGYSLRTTGAATEQKGRKKKTASAGRPEKGNGSIPGSVGCSGLDETALGLPGLGLTRVRV